MNVVEDAKDALLGHDIIKEYTLEKKFTKTDGEYIADKFFPKIFWELSHYVDIKNSEDGKKLKFQTHTDSLEELVALAILNKSSNKFYDACASEINGSAYKPYRIVVNESYYTKEKWGEEQIRKSCLISYQTMSKNGNWTVDYESHSSNAQYALTTIPKFFYEYAEGLTVPFKWSSFNRDISQQTIEDYPYFEYKGYVFKTTQWIPSQKCVCGHCDDYIDEYEGESDIKVEVWEVRCFEKDTVYLSDNRLICNGSHVVLNKEEMDSLEMKGYHKDDMKDYLIKIFPEAKEFNAWFTAYKL